MSYFNIKSSPVSYGQLNNIGLSVGNQSNTAPSNEFYELEPAIVLDVILDETHPEIVNKRHLVDSKNIPQNYKGDDYAKYLQFVERFTELGANLGITVNKYSNGMQGRLGLALSLLEKPEILLIDENIGAGDAHFQERTASTLEQYIHSVPIVVMASHSETLMRQYCNKAAFMKNGKVIFFGISTSIFSSISIVSSSTLVPPS